jgi:phosphohistidine phosphatase
MEDKIMKHLFLLRHAHSDNNSLDDFDRTLSQNGIDKCQSVGKILADYNIDIIYSSDSIRTKQTVENITSNLKIMPKIIYLHELYKSSATKLEQFVLDISPEHNNILLVNHNPAISEFAMYLSKTSMSSELYEEINKGFSPASLALFIDNKLASFWR